MKHPIRALFVLALLVCMLLAGTVTADAAGTKIYFPGSTRAYIVPPSGWWECPDESNDEEKTIYYASDIYGDYSEWTKLYTVKVQEPFDSLKIVNYLFMHHYGYCNQRISEIGELNGVPYAFIGMSQMNVAENDIFIYAFYDDYTLYIIDHPDVCGFTNAYFIEQIAKTFSVTSATPNPTPAPTPVPVSPVTLTNAAQVGKSGVKLYYTPAANTKYAVYRSTSPDSGFIWVSNLTAPTGRDTVYVGKAGVTYYYKLRPFRENTDGARTYGNYSNAVKVSMLTASGITSAKPYSTNGAKVQFKPVSGATGYALYLKKQGDPGDYIWRQTTTGLTAYAYNLDPGANYWFQVRAVCDQPDGTRGVGLSSPAARLIVPGIPKNVKGTWSAISKTATISWGRVYNITGYEVYTSTSAYGTYRLAGRTTATSLKVANLTRNKTAHFKVRCYVQLDDGTRAYGSYTSPLAVVIK